MFSKQNYGPNTAQVRRFIEQVHSLTPSQWDKVEDASSTAQAAYGFSDWLQTEAMAATKYGRDRSDKWIECAGRDLDKSLEGATISKHSLIAQSAVLGLVHCEVMTRAWFAACYAPFVELIPIENLGEGKAPAVGKPPETTWGRFITRVDALGGPDQQQVVTTACAVEDAVGAPAIEAALDAALDAIEKKADDQIKADFLALSESVDSVGQEDANRQREGFETIGRFLKRDDFAAAHSARIDTELAGLRLATGQAAIALMARDFLSRQEFAILYLPFSGLIPVESLEVSHLR